MLVCHFDYTSPAAAVAVLRLHRIVDAGGRVGFSGFDTLGLDAAIPVTLDQLEELERHRPAAVSLGLAVRRPTLRPPTLGAHLVGDLAESVDLGASWRETVLRAYFERGVDLGDGGALAELGQMAGLDAAEVADLLADRTARTALRRRMLLVRGRGIGGVPVLDVDGTLVSADLPDADLRQLAAS
jgi:predicted DsbA family dithiol-disulfide isomerase